MKRILIIQTAFIGDAILATSLLESLHLRFPDSALDILVRKGNEALFHQHPYIDHVYTWDKSGNKIPKLFSLARKVRQHKPDLTINIQRFFSSGLLSALIAAGETRGFRKNPLSFLFTKRYEHRIGSDGLHEIQRNHQLIKDIVQTEEPARPRLYPGQEDSVKVDELKLSDFICIAPASVWYTKQYPAQQWIRMINRIPTDKEILLIGSAGDFQLCEKIREGSEHKGIRTLCGQLGLLASAELMSRANMNFVNDSAPLHLASAVNAPVTAVFCSTLPSFGFGPLSDVSYIAEANPPPACRPCGLHGLKACPEKHFKCAMEISLDDLLIPVTKDDQS